MKAEHRHELKTNELAEWLSNFPQWAKKNIKIIIYVSVVVLLAGGSYFYRGYQKNVVAVQKKLALTGILSQIEQNKAKVIQSQVDGFDSAYMLLQTADSLGASAQDADNDQMAALALIKKAEILRTELHYRLGAVSRQDIIAQVNQAKAICAQAVEKAASNPSLTALAQFGIGLCAEELGAFAEAEDIYRLISTNPDFDGTTAAVQAKQRLRKMTYYQEPIAFRPAPKPELDAVQPPIQLQPFEQTQQETLQAPDVNLPAQN